MAKRWSSLRKQIEALFAPGLDLRIHCTHYNKRHHRIGALDEVRYWLVLDKRVIWDCPCDFWATKHPALGKPVINWEDVLWPSPVGSCISETLRVYLDRPRERLFDPIDRDDWLLGDLLRAADRRVGRTRLRMLAEVLPAGHPALAILRSRTGATSRNAA